MFNFSNIIGFSLLSLGAMSAVYGASVISEIPAMERAIASSVTNTQSSAVAMNCVQSIVVIDGSEYPHEICK